MKKRDTNVVKLKASAGFNVGDVVRLKSETHQMTVEAVGDAIKCVWFGYESQLHRAEFKPAVLEHVVPLR